MSSLHLIQHRFAGWAAASAASASPRCRFKVSVGVAILEAIGFGPAYNDPRHLPSPQRFDTVHRGWRIEAIQAAKKRGIQMSHGVAAKLINVYLKSRFVCGGFSQHPKIAAIHPPIDSILLRALEMASHPEDKPIWRKLMKARWSKFDSETYEHAHKAIALTTAPLPAWTIETQWRPE